MTDDASGQSASGTDRLVIGWTCDDCEEAIGDEPRMWDLAEKLRKEHEEETGHTTTVEVIEEKRILPSQADRMDLGEHVIEMADAEIDWICPECHRSGEDLGTTKRCPDCDERLREVLPDGGTERGGTDRFDPAEYDGPEDLLDEWRSNFERLMDGRWPDDEVSLEWDTTDDEAVLRLEEPPETVIHVDRAGGGPSRSIWVYFDRAIDAAQESERFISTQENPMGAGDRKHSAMLAVPVADNREEMLA